MDPHEHVFKNVAFSLGIIWRECVHGCGKMELARYQERRGSVWRSGLGEKVVACAGVIDEAK